MEQPAYECQHCGHEFKKDKPGPTECPVCLGVYVKWLNFATWEHRNEKRS